VHEALKKHTARNTAFTKRKEPAESLKKCSERKRSVIHKPGGSARLHPATPMHQGGIKNPKTKRMFQKTNREASFRQDRGAVSRLQQTINSYSRFGANSFNSSAASPRHRQLRATGDTAPPSAFPRPTRAPSRQRIHEPTEEIFVRDSERALVSADTSQRPHRRRSAGSNARGCGGGDARLLKRSPGPPRPRTAAARLRQPRAEFCRV